MGNLFPKKMKKLPRENRDPLPKDIDEYPQGKIGKPLPGKMKIAPLTSIIVVPLIRTTWP